MEILSKEPRSVNDANSSITYRWEKIKLSNHFTMTWVLTKKENFMITHTEYSICQVSNLISVSYYNVKIDDITEEQKFFYFQHPEEFLMNYAC